jgi:putative protease
MYELLSPAGDFERLEAAITYGADAVYFSGRSFTLRTSPDNFSEDGLEAAVGFSRERGVKAYIACTGFPRNGEIDDLARFLKRVGEIKPDAFIAADLGVLSLIKKHAPDTDVHISVQTGTLNYETARTLYNMGAKRVILARELTIEEIAEIRAKTPSALELEAFVHGAMCVSVSGRCFLSQYLTGRDANRGDCAQPCRWPFALCREDGSGGSFPVYEDDGGAYILNAKDLCAIGILDRLSAAGVTGFKIEGRAKSAYYTAVITNAYRQAVDILEKSPGGYALPDYIRDEVNKVSHREYCEGFYTGAENAAQNYKTGGYTRDCEVVAVIEGCADGFVTATQRNKFAVGDEVEILAPGQRFDTITIESLINENGDRINDLPHAKMKFKFPCEKTYPKHAIIRKTKKGGFAP